MASRRRYKVPGYRDGGAVPFTSGAATPEVVEQPELASADAPPPPPAADDAILRAVEAQRQAEALHHRRMQEPQSVDQYVDSLPNLSDHKRRFLKANSEMLNGEQRELMSQAYVEAMQAGMRDDTPELDRWLVDTVRDEMNSRRARLADAARSAADTMLQPPRHHADSNVDEVVARLNAEVSALNGAYNARQAAPDVLASQLPQPEPTPRAPRMPMTAPVSRDVPMLSGQRQASAPGMTLSPEERVIARNSFSDPSMSDAQKERIYAMNKARLQRERAEGRYPQSGQG